VLDTSKGRPASGIPVGLLSGKTWRALKKGTTDTDGRVSDLFPTDLRFQEGTYRLTFDSAAYFRVQKVVSFYPEISVVFLVRDATQHYHIPLLVTPYGYTTYRGT
jgi:5-hydroxyisourate hydrolase